MADTDKTITAQKQKAPAFKKGQVLIEGAHFNDDWARTKTKDEFIAEFSDALFQDKTVEARTQVLSIAWDACKNAE
jgi:hypothetical protein